MPAQHPLQQRGQNPSREVDRMKHVTLDLARGLLVLVTTVGGVAGALPARAACPPRATWPTPDWEDATAQTMQQKSAQVAALESYAFTLKGADNAREGIRTDGVVIIHAGRVVYEKYARGYTAQSPHLAWSATKSVTSALTGIAVARGLLRVEDSICLHRRFDNPEVCRITVEDLLTFGSGLEWSESYENDLPRASSVGAMLYGEGHKDMVKFVAGHPFRANPGETWSYSSGDTVLLSGVLQQVMGPQDFLFTHTLLFNRLGMTRSTVERDQKGVFVGSSYWYAPPREMARFGYLYLNDGCWRGERLLPEGWVATSVAPSEPLKRNRITTDPTDVSGYSWWLNRPVPEANIPVPFPDVPEDAYAARGHWGQSITVVPSRDVIIVRVGDDRETGVMDYNQFLKLALEVAP